MIQLIKKIFGGGNSASLNELIERGAVIVDVRSAAEFSGGHLSNSGCPETQPLQTG
jgi:rhodanese-related sulfurtransferase